MTGRSEATKADAPHLREERVPAEDGGSLHLLRWGAPHGKRLLFLHGMGGSNHWWETSARHYADFDCAALSFRGHGESDWRADGAYSVEGFAQDIETARHALGWTTFDLVAHSMGSWIAMAYSARHPHALRKLVLVDFLPPARMHRLKRYSKRLNRLQPGYDTQHEILERFHLEPEGTLLSGEELKSLGKKLILKREDGRWAWRFDWKAFGLPATQHWPDPAAAKTPALLIRGEHSRVMKPEDLDEVAARMPRAQTLTIAKAHHHVPLDLPAELAEAVRGFLRD